MNRRDFLKTAGLGTAALALSRFAWTAEPRLPNIVLILADDLGYGELSAQGCRDIPTPNIDSIARAGVRFTDGYVSCPVCAPTRAGLMTGRYQQRFGLETNPGPQDAAPEIYGLPRTEPILPERLKPLGYATGMVGKWHLGYQPGVQPPQRGFDEFFGSLGGAHGFVPGPRKSDPILRGTTPVAVKDYLTDAFGREAVAFIEKHQQEPFFLYLPFTEVHAPMQGVDRYTQRFPGIANGKRRTFAGKLGALDENVGRVLDTLKRLSLTDNTMVIFLSDNGGPTALTTSSNGPLHGFKGETYEGGLRIPFMMQWPGHIPAGQTLSQPVISLDLLPTILAAAGQQPPPDAKLDGVNLLPLLSGQNPAPPHETLYWRYRDRCAIRQGDWKLVMPQANRQWELYNLADDLGEKHNLADKQPDRVKALQAAWEAWSAELPPVERGGDAANQAGRIRKRLKKLDKNNDGKLTPDEVPQERLFKQMDANGDGTVSFEEARAHYGRRGAGNP